MEVLAVKKIPFYRELAYPIGLAVLALGTALMEKAAFGMSMVTAPAYIIWSKLVLSLPQLSFGTVSYLFEAALLLLLMLLLRRFRLSYLLSFVTAVLFGLLLDACMALTGLLPYTIVARIIYYVSGTVICSLGVALLFHTYFTPEAYELFVKEIARAKGMELGRCKTIYDCSSCGFALLLSFLLFGFGQFVGVGVGTILCALVNGKLITLLSKALEKRFNFTDAIQNKRFRGFFAD